MTRRKRKTSRSISAVPVVQSNKKDKTGRREILKSHPYKSSMKKSKIPSRRTSWWSWLWWHLDYWTNFTTTWAQMPTHLQFNPYIQNGYRKVTDWKGCLFSLLFLHNETANILTHGPIAFYTLKRWNEFWPWESLYGQPYLYGLGISHTIAMLVPWIPSCFYHLFMCHRSGPKFYKTLLKFDTVGIWMTEFFGSLTNLAATMWYLPEGLQGILMGIFNVTSFYGLSKVAKASTPKERVICFTPLLIARILSILLRLTPWGGGDIGVLHHVILQDFTSIAGGFIGIFRVPEKWFRGNYDYFFNSHNIMHLLVILAVWHMNAASNGDVKWIISQISKT